MRALRHGAMIAAAALGATAAATRTASAQESSVEGHLNYSRTTQAPHSNSWGGGVQYGLTFGSKHKPQLATSLGADYVKQEKGGPSQVSGSLDATVQLSAGPLLSPYAGGSVGIVRSSGGGQSSTDPQYQYIVGTLLKLESQSPLSLRFEVRPGYVSGQPHTITGRFGVNMSL